ncbi:MAG: NAD-dependent succinate-semialdehyde dehydrogenase [Pontibacterium sp.]
MALPLKDASLLKTQAYINGQWVNGEEAQPFSVTNPATGEVITHVANVSLSQVKAAITGADDAIAQWKALPVKTRADVIERWYQLVLANREDLAVIMTMEQGKPLFESRGEVDYGAGYIKWFAEEAKRIYGDVLSSTSDRRGLVIKQPVGVVAAITPWNFPNAMITRKVAPALAAGCTIVLKPAAETPLSALALAELAARAGIPAGVFSVLPSNNSRMVGAELTANPTVKKLTFTGSTPVGKLLMKQCVDTVKRTSMELGGNAPVIIFDDADIEKAIQGALISKFRNSGQTCICANRLLVQEGIYDEFVAKFSAAVEAFKLGNGMDETSTHGPVVTKKAAADIQAKVDAAIAEGAQVHLGGKVSDLGEQFFEPTILTHVTDQMAIFKEEIFGPVAPIFKFTSEEEAIAMANDTEFGLAAYVYTNNLSRIWRVSEAIEYGMVGVNETAISSEMIPFGGVKESGQGREGSKYGLDDYLETKYICMGGL